MEIQRILSEKNLVAFKLIFMDIINPLLRDVNQLFNRITGLQFLHVLTLEPKKA